MSRILAIMGSGETAPTMVKPHRAILAAAGPGPVVMLDTPFGFQENADELTAKTIAYFRESVFEGVTREVGVATFRRADTADALALEQLRLSLRGAQVVLAGPGSPSYALRQWAGSPVPDELSTKLRTGGSVSFSSAAALTLGSYTVPVYEVYKVGADPEWLPGLDLMREAGLHAAVIPHFDNAEGGTHDTRFCYLGERRLRMLEERLPAGTFVFGVDEHTAAVLDLDAARLEVIGRGGVTIRSEGRTHVLPAGTQIPIEDVSVLAAGGGAAPSSAVRTAAAAPVAPPASGPGPVLEAAATAESAFDAALAHADADAAVRAVLALDGELHAWRTDPTQSDELDRARALLRGLIVRLGSVAQDGLVDPVARFGPFVDLLLEVRRDAREQGRWADADAVRDGLTGLGIEVNDTPDGTVWSAPGTPQPSGQRSGFGPS